MTPPSENVFEHLSGTILLVAEANGSHSSVIWACPVWARLATLGLGKRA